jgi:uncharacterized SAM-binding protein YcdF (DUF218 family)
MFFFLSKILGFFASPSNALIVLGLLGALLLPTRFMRAGQRMLVASIFLIAIFGLTPLGNALIFPLEDRFPKWEESGPPPDGIVVLGGAIDDLVSPARDAVVLTDAAERMTAAVYLSRRYPQARIVFSGGSGRLISGGVAETVVAKRFFDEMGVAADRVLLEGASRNTSENAIFSKRIADPKPGERWLLVTSAYHMPRSIGIFRREGFPIEAYPVDWRTRGPADLARGFDRMAEGLRRSDIAIREWVGLLIYWITGRSSELLPGPIAVR